MASRSPVSAVAILQRHHFSSALQRMSTVATVVLKGGGSEVRCLVKGSPEAIGKLLHAEKHGGKPGWYDPTHQRLSEQGLRVLALAYKRRAVGLTYGGDGPPDEMRLKGRLEAHIDLDEPAAMRGGGVRQSGRAVATKELEVAPRNCIASISSSLALCRRNLPVVGRSQSGVDVIVSRSASN